MARMDCSYQNPFGSSSSITGNSMSIVPSTEVRDIRKTASSFRLKCQWVPASAFILQYVGPCFR